MSKTSEMACLLFFLVRIIAQPKSQPYKGLEGTACSALKDTTWRLFCCAMIKLFFFLVFYCPRMICAAFLFLFGQTMRGDGAFCAIQHPFRLMQLAGHPAPSPPTVKTVSSPAPPRKGVLHLFDL